MLLVACLERTPQRYAPYRQSSTSKLRPWPAPIPVVRIADQFQPIPASSARQWLRPISSGLPAAYAGEEHRNLHRREAGFKGQTFDEVLHLDVMPGLIVVDILLQVRQERGRDVLDLGVRLVADAAVRRFALYEELVQLRAVRLKLRCLEHHRPIDFSCDRIEFHRSQPLG